MVLAGKPLSKWLADHPMGKAEDPNESRAVFVVSDRPCSPLQCHNMQDLPPGKSKKSSVTKVCSRSTLSPTCSTQEIMQNILVGIVSCLLWV